MLYGGSSRTVSGGHGGVEGIDEDISSLYGEEHLFFGSLTANLGLRWDRQNGRFGSASTDWTVLAPRLGLTWTPGASGRTLLSAGYSRLAGLLGPVSSPDQPPAAQHLRPPMTDQVLLGVQYKLDAPAETAAGLQLTWRRTEDLERRAATLSLVRPLLSRMMVRSYLTWQDRAPSGQQPDALLQSRWSYGLAAFYRIRPDTSWGFDVGANWIGRQGFPPGDAERQDDVHLLDLRVQRERWSGRNSG